MADMIVEYRVMPSTEEEVEYLDLERAVKKTVGDYKDDVSVLEVSSESMGFGILAVRIKFQMDENHGTDGIEEQLESLNEVGEVQCTLMDRL